MRIHGPGNSCYQGTVLPRGSYRRGKAAESDVGIRQIERQITQMDFFLPAVLKFEEMIKTRKMPQTYDQIVEKTQVFLAMFQSLMEGGREIEVAWLDEDWTAPNPFPGFFPDGYFPKVS